MADPVLQAKFSIKKLAKAVLTEEKLKMKQIENCNRIIATILGKSSFFIIVSSPKHNKPRLVKASRAPIRCLVFKFKWLWLLFDDDMDVNGVVFSIIRGPPFANFWLCCDIVDTFNGCMDRLCPRVWPRFGPDDAGTGGMCFSIYSETNVVALSLVMWYVLNGNRCFFGLLHMFHTDLENVHSFHLTPIVINTAQFHHSNSIWSDWYFASHFNNLFKFKDHCTVVVVVVRLFFPYNFIECFTIVAGCGCCCRCCCL